MTRPGRFLLARNYYRITIAWVLMVAVQAAIIANPYWRI